MRVYRAKTMEGLAERITTEKGSDMKGEPWGKAEEKNTATTYKKVV